MMVFGESKNEIKKLFRAFSPLDTLIVQSGPARK